MVTSNQIPTQAAPAVFHHHILSNLNYWRDYVLAHPTDRAALEHGRSRIMTAISFALALEEAWPALRDLIEAYTPHIERGGYWTPWSLLLSQAVEAGQQRGERAGVVLLSALLARLWQQSGRLRRAIAQHRTTIRLARHSGDLYNEARACSNLGYLFVEEGRWYRAEVLCQHALTLFEQLDSHHGRAHTENHLGILYTHQCHWVRARQHLAQACALWQAMGDDNGLMQGLINLAVLSNEMAQPAQSLTYLDEALALAHRTGEEAELGAIYLNRGLAHYLAGDLAQAEAEIWRAEAICRQLGYSIRLAEVWHDLGLIYTAQGNWPEAYRYLTAAREVWRGQDKYHETKILKAMVEYELARGHRSGAQAQLEELARFIARHHQAGCHDQLQARLEHYRNWLAE